MTAARTWTISRTSNASAIATGIAIGTALSAAAIWSAVSFARILTEDSVKRLVKTTTNSVTIAASSESATEKSLS